jgi:hypothetical protein
MARVASLILRKHIDADLLLAVARRMPGSPLRRSLAFVRLPEIVVEDEIEPFFDWDAWRGHGAGYFRQDADECRTRRVDLRAPTDEDPGPLPMEEAPEDITAKHLILG